ncbi:hypothetical protein ACWEOA_39235, partial [Streptomyces sp. NPDC004457]
RKEIPRWPAAVRLGPLVPAGALGTAAGPCAGSLPSLVLCALLLLLPVLSPSPPGAATASVGPDAP